MKFKFKQIRSSIGSTQKQKSNLAALRLGKIGQESVFEGTAAVLGRLSVVKHLIQVEKI